MFSVLNTIYRLLTEQGVLSLLLPTIFVPNKVAYIFTFHHINMLIVNESYFCFSHSANYIGLIIVVLLPWLDLLTYQIPVN